MTSCNSKASRKFQHTDNVLEQSLEIIGFRACYSQARITQPNGEIRVSYLTRRYRQITRLVDGMSASAEHVITEEISNFKEGTAGRMQLTTTSKVVSFVDWFQFC